jgi:hypothetical protein
VRRARPPVGAFHVEAHTLAAGECVEVQRGVDAAAMEELLRSILGGDEPEAALSDDFLDGPSHLGASTILPRY